MATGSTRRDYGFPFRIDGASGQVAQSPPDKHVAEMVRQVLLTAPGERVNAPDFGCALRRVVFGPNRSSAPAAALAGAVGGGPLDASIQVLVQHALSTYLGDRIEVLAVAVAAGAEGNDGELLVTVTYRLLVSREQAAITVRVT